MAESKPREITAADGFKAVGDEKLRKVMLRIDAKVHEGDQSDFFGRIAKRRAEYNSTLSRLRALQAETHRAAKEAFQDRAPCPFVPYSPAPWSIIVATDLNDLDKLVFITLLRFAGSKKNAWPSQEKLAQTLSKSVRSIQRALTRLNRKGYLAISMRCVHGEKWVNQYDLNLDDIRTRVRNKPTSSDP